jgi:hypothetical protein
MALTVLSQQENEMPVHLLVQGISGYHHLRKIDGLIQIPLCRSQPRETYQDIQPKGKQVLPARNGPILVPILRQQVIGIQPKGTDASISILRG